jgi:hypothetical protein
LSRQRKINRLCALLYDFRGHSAHNQYRDVASGLERENGAEIRLQNLRIYLEAFADASYILVGEAAGYAGCRFSGIPFTGEAQIVGPECLPWAQSRDLQQSSLGDLWRERSGTMVWEALNGRMDCVLWNTFPWHPYGKDRLSNRKPKRAEIVQALPILSCFLDLYRDARVYAIGRVSEETLHRMDIQTTYIRHPSHGGKRQFRQAIEEMPRVDL